MHTIEVMGMSRLSILPVLGKICVVGLLLMSGVAKAESDPLVERREALAWLGKIQGAAQKQNYAGTFILQHGNMVQSTRIQHLYEWGTEYEKMEVLDGRPRVVYRQNELIQALIPEKKLCLIEKRDAKDTFPALIATTGNAILEQYTVRKEDHDRIAGLDCQEISLTPNDGYRYRYRLWADRQSGLLMRAQTISDTGEILEQVSFSQIAIGTQLDKSKLKLKVTDIQGWQQENIDGVPVNVAEFGWIFKPMMVPGFTKILERKRNMPGPDGIKEVFQVIYSDGMAAISVFIEPMSSVHPARDSMRRGATNVLFRRIHENGVVIVGETPLATLQMFANGIEFRPPAGTAAK